MKVPVSVSNQAHVFLCMVIGGMMIAFVYDIIRIKRRTIKTNIAFVNIEDFLYWIVVALVMFSVVYYSNEGEIRGYIFVGAAIGAILYTLVLSKFVIKISIVVIRIVCRIISALWKIISYPFKIILKILGVPAKFIMKVIIKQFKSMKRASKNKTANMMIWRKIIKNFCRKI